MRKKYFSKGMSRTLSMGLIAFIALLAVTPLMAQGDPQATHAFGQSVRLLASADSYRFQTDVEQRFLPIPGTGHFVREERVDYFMAGATAGDRFDLEMWGEDRSVVPPVRYFHDENGLFIQREGELEQLEERTHQLTAGPDMFMAYLESAVNIQELEPTTANGQAFSRFSFDIDSQIYAEQMRELNQAAFHDVLPMGTAMGVDERDLATSGFGEIWIDEQGLPARQIINVYRPDASEEYDASIRMVVTLSNVDGVESLPTVDGGAIIDTPISNHTFVERLGDSVVASAEPENFLPFVFVVLALLLIIGSVLLYQRRPHAVHTGLAIFLVTAMLAAPSLQSVAYGQSHSRFNEYVESHKAEAEGDSAVSEIIANLADSQPYEPEYRLSSISSPTENTNTINQCGDGSATADADGDGISDFDEGCLGTNPYLTDTDSDLLSDYVEVTGFTYNGKTWFSDPFLADSNRDGVADYQEWNNTAYTLTDEFGKTHEVKEGGSSSWDLDGDGVPNIWDDDNDGDGVTDGRDISPFSVGNEYHNQINLETQNANDTGYQYVEFQVQPEDQSLLRYSVGTLDWPQDDAGQIKDETNIPNDIRLVPMLEISSNIRPGEDDLYGYSPGSKNDGSFKTLVPLAPVEDNGRISAFSAKIVFPPGQNDSVKLYAKLIWIVNQDQGDKSRAIHIYGGQPIRLTGLQVTRSGEVEIAHYATPSTGLEDSDLFKFVFGLNSTYMQSADYPLSRVQSLVNNNGLNATWGVENGIVMSEPETYPHLDHALMRGNTKAFLQEHIDPTTNQRQCTDMSGNQPYCATIAISTDFAAGSRNLDELGQFGQNVRFDMANVIMVGSRSLRVAMYEKPAANSEWKPMEPSRVSEMIMARYDQSKSQEIIASLGEAGIGLNMSDIQLNALLPYNIWTNGYSSQVTLNGVVLPTDFSASTVAELDGQVDSIFGSVSETLTVPGMILDIVDGATDLRDPIDIPAAKSEAFENLGGADALGEALEDSFADFLSGASDGIISDGVNNFNASVETAWNKSVTWQKGEKIWQTATMISGGAVVVSTITMSILQTASNCSDYDDPESECQLDKTALSAVDWTIQSVSLLTQLSDLTNTLVNIKLDGISTALEFLDDAGAKTTIFESASKLGQAAAVVGFVIEVGMTWVNFALTVTSGVNEIQIKAAVATAIVTTIITVFFFVINFWPVVGQVISFIKAIIDLILIIVDIILKALGIDVNSSDWLIQKLIEFFYSVRMVTEIVEGFGIRNSKTDPPEDGLIAGETIRFSGEFNGEIKQILRASGSEQTREIVNSPKRLNESYIRGYYEVDPAFGVYDSEDPRSLGNFVSNTISHVKGEEKCTIFSEATFSQIIGGERQARCVNDTTVNIRIFEARRNVGIEVAQTIEYRLRYSECSFYGSVCLIVRNLDGTLPGEGETPNSFELVYDILPRTVEDFWEWDDIVNRDQDGDGLLDSEEANIGTDPTKWDTDGDGVSDSFEHESRASLGTNPLLLDSDGDGLTDYEEISYGTRADSADSDQDGLDDAVELCRVDGTGNLVGGWQVAGQNKSYHICSNPSRQDLDGDKKIDGSELNPTTRASQNATGTSPFAANSGPSLQLITVPQPTSHKGVGFTVVKPSDNVGLGVQIFNGAASPIDQPLELCLPNNLRLVEAGDLTGDRTIQPTTGSCENNGTLVRWNLSGINELRTAESVKGTVMAVAVAQRTPEIDARPATLTTQWDGKDFWSVSQVVVDEDNPTITIQSPSEGEMIGRLPNQSTYMVLGIASDPTSWIDSVTSSTGGTTAVSGLDTWATRWTLPTTDGFYDINVQAADVVGNTAQDSVRVFVDGTPPVATSTIPDVISRSNGDGARVDLDLTGTVTDKTANTNGSGVTKVEIRLDGTVWRTASLSAKDENGQHTWSIKIPVDIGRAQGSHEVEIRAWDAAGNVSNLTDGFLVDVTPPKDELADSRYLNQQVPQLNSDAGATLNGFINDSGYLPAQSLPANLQGEIDSIKLATVWLTPDSVVDYAGGANAVWLGDINGDSYADLAVGLPGSDGGNGRVTVMHGRAGDWTQPAAAERLFEQSINYIGSTTNSNIGQMIASAGDVNADGLFDMLVGDPEANVVYLILGSVTEFDSTTTLSPDTTDADVIVIPLFNGSNLLTIGPAGDVNGDTYDDFIIATFDQVLLINGDPRPQAVSDLLTMPSLRYAPAGNLVSAVGVGDTDGDGFDDIAVVSTAGTEVLPGRASYSRGTVVSPASGSGQLRGTGWATPLGDVDGNGLDDFMLHTDFGSNPTLVKSGVGTERFDNRAYQSGKTAGVGDVNGDGCSDLLLVGTDGKGYLHQSERADGAATCTPPTQGNVVILSDVISAAQAPYATGADVNGDRSADLLLIPSTINAFSAGSLRVSSSSFVPSYLLPQGSVSAPAKDIAQSRAAQVCSDPSVIYVDDDWANAPAGIDADGAGGGIQLSCDQFATINDALNGSDPLDQIIIHPGVYGPINSSLTLSGIKIEGVSADAVIIDGDGGDAITLQTALDVKISNVTIRNADTAIKTSVGQLTLSDSVVVNFDHLLSAGQSQVTIAHSTIDGGSGTGVYILPFLDLGGLNHGKLALDRTIILPRPNNTQTDFYQPVTISDDTKFFSDSDGGRSIMVAGNWNLRMPGNFPFNATFSDRPEVDLDLQDRSKNLYRMGSNVNLPAFMGPELAGYALYAPPAQVVLSSVDCPSCANRFDTVQEAIDSGAREITIYPGVHQQAEPFYLTSGITLRGIDTEKVVVQVPSFQTGWNNQYVMRMEGVAHVEVSDFTLESDYGYGQGPATAVYLNDGISEVHLNRLLILGFNQGVYSDAQGGAEISQNTFVDNRGQAIHSCGDTIYNNAFVKNGTALRLNDLGAIPDDCTPLTFNQYNAFWNNGVNASAGAGSSLVDLDGTNVFQNPRFEDPQNGNYRLQSISPLVDAGRNENNQTLVPDIGYCESLSGDILVSGDFCETCDNNGLAWGETAFLDIQPAVEKAREIVPALGCGGAGLSGDKCDRRVTVRVLPGTYPDDIMLYSHIDLLGSGADQTMLTDRIILADSVDNRIAGFNFTGSAGIVAGQSVASNLLIERNLFDVTGQAILIQQNTQADIIFNTFRGVQGGTGGVRVTGSGNQVIVNNNIFTGMNGDALHLSGSGQLFHHYNLYFDNRTNFDGAISQNEAEIVGQDPQLNASGEPTIGSLAIDAADPAMAPPAGGGQFADIGYAELTAPPLTMLFGKIGQSRVFGSAGVDQHEIAIVPVADVNTFYWETLPADEDWQAVNLGSESGKSFIGWAHTVPASLAEGHYRIFTRPTDVLDNVTNSPFYWYRGMFFNDKTDPVMTVNAPANGVSLTTDVVQFSVTVDEENLTSVSFRNGDDPVVQGAIGLVDDMTRTATGIVPLASGANTVTVKAVDLAGNSVSQTIVVNTTAADPLPVSGDVTPPAINTPSANLNVNGPILLTGTASDASGIARVLISLDGGMIWQPANFSNGTWGYQFEPEPNTDFIILPVMVRAFDVAGQSAEASMTLTVDTAAPEFTGDVELSLPSTFHYDGEQTITVDWEAVDGDPNLTYFATLNTLTTTVPTAGDSVADSMATFQITQQGEWYVHVMAQDSAGNKTTEAFGPWHVSTQPGQNNGRAATTWTESIQVDGILEDERNEWEADERIDDDERSNSTRTFYTNWDAQGLYFAVDGAPLNTDGTLHLYLDVAAGGRNTGAQAMNQQILPFEADYLVALDQQGDGTLYNLVSGTWTVMTLNGFKAIHGDGGQTEIFIPYGPFSSGQVKVTAFVFNDDNALTSAFPTANALTGPLTRFYNWTDTSQPTAPKDGQANATTLSLEFSAVADPADGAFVSPGQEITYLMSLTNNEQEAVSGVLYQIVESHTGSPMSGSVPPLAPGETVTWTVKTAAPTNGDTALSAEVTIYPDAFDPLISQVDFSNHPPIALSHTLDLAAPTPAISEDGLTIDQTGAVYGAATDDGTGVAMVEMLLDGNWVEANGLNAWQVVIPPNLQNVSSLDVQVRATDHAGNVSQPVSYTLMTDRQAPVVTAEIPAVINSSVQQINGTVSDNLSEIASVEVQIGSEGNWQQATVNGGSWQLPWSLPAVDGGAIEVSVRATDAAGNRSALVTSSHTLDNVLPDLTVLKLVEEIDPTDSVSTTLIEGIVNDGSGIESLVVTMLRPDGTTATFAESIAANGSWSFSAILEQKGTYYFNVDVIDSAGNGLRAGTIAIEAINPNERYRLLLPIVNR
ncbi:MAG: Ig-like domain-containing protein [Chloroflexota bacterium]